MNPVLEAVYWAENGGYYDKQAFLDLAKGDEALADRGLIVANIANVSSQ